MFISIIPSGVRIEGIFFLPLPLPFFPYPSPVPRPSFFSPSVGDITEDQRDLFDVTVDLPLFWNICSTSPLCTKNPLICKAGRAWSQPFPSINVSFLPVDEIYAYYPSPPLRSIFPLLFNLCETLSTVPPPPLCLYPGFKPFGLLPVLWFASLIL